MSRLVPWKFRWWENKAPYDLINEQPFGGHTTAGRSARAAPAGAAHRSPRVGSILARQSTAILPSSENRFLSGRSSSGEVARGWGEEVGRGGGEEDEAKREKRSDPLSRPEALH